MLIRAIDRAHTMTQLVAKSYGFLDRRDPGIEQAHDGDPDVVAFGEAPGWRPFTVRLPPGSAFVQGGSSVLTRYGIWQAAPAALDVDDRLEEEADALGTVVSVQVENGTRQWSIKRPDGERIEIKARESAGGLHIGIRQRRAGVGLREAVSAALQTRPSTGG